MAQSSRASSNSCCITRHEVWSRNLSKTWPGGSLHLVVPPLWLQVGGGQEASPSGGVSVGKAVGLGSLGLCLETFPMVTGPCASYMGAQGSREESQIFLVFSVFSLCLYWKLVDVCVSRVWTLFCCIDQHVHRLSHNHFSSAPRKDKVPVY